MSIRTSRSSKRLIAAAVAVAVTASTFAISNTSSAWHPSGDIYAPVTTRVGGADRFSTSSLVALKGSYTDVIIVNGRNFPDALAAGALASYEDAAILLVEQDSIPASTQVALTTIDPNEIHIVGGTAAVSAAVATALQAYVSAPSDVTRIAGSDRYATALEVAGSIGNVSEVIIATGQNFVDAMTASVLSWQTGFPILLNDGPQLSDAVVKFLNDNDIEKAHLIGGEAVVPASVATQLTSSLGVQVARLGGATRFETATAIAAALVAFDPDYKERVVLANARTFADALTAAPLAGNLYAPILLVESGSIPAATAKWHVDNKATIENIWAIGGTTAIAESVLTGAATAAAQERPTVQSATLTVTHTAATVDLEDLNGGNVVKLTAAATGDSRGVFGNDWSVIVVEDNTKTAVSVEVDAIAQEITVTGNSGVTAAKLTATNVVAAWTGSAAASALFTATADAAAATKEVDAGTVTIATGATDVTVATAFSVAIGAAGLSTTALDVYPSNLNLATALLVQTSGVASWASNTKLPVS